MDTNTVVEIGKKNTPEQLLMNLLTLIDDVLYYANQIS